MSHELLYIDPGSGSYLVQVIIAALLGIVFFFKNIGRFFKNAWWYIKSFFVRSPKKSNDN
ncbi:MAG: hypothetical protein C4308_00895 [Chitinophagaceae bacterium]